MIVLLTGATGFIGSAVAARLAQAGHSLRALTRNPQVNQARLPAGCAAYAWSEGGTVPPEALDGADAVIHLAGESLAGGRWTAASKQRMRGSPVDGTRGL